MHTPHMPAHTTYKLENPSTITHTTENTFPRMNTHHIYCTHTHYTTYIPHDTHSHTHTHTHTHTHLYALGPRRRRTS